MKYIDSEKLKAEIERRKQVHFDDYFIKKRGNPADYGASNALAQVLSFIDSLQQEQPETSNNLVDVDAVREDFMREVYRVLDADPTNDRANAIIDTFDSLPTVSQEQPEVDLEEEIDKVWNNGLSDELAGPHNNFDICARLARHFYNLGLNARKV